MSVTGGADLSLVVGIWPWLLLYVPEAVISAVPVLTQSRGAVSGCAEERRRMTAWNEFTGAGVSCG